jgi:hypothetical protein
MADQRQDQDDEEREITPFTIAERFGRGELTRDEVIRELIDYDYLPQAANQPGVQSLRQYAVSGATQPAKLTSVAQRQGGMQPVDAQAYRSARAAGMVQALPGSTTGMPQQAAGAAQQLPGAAHGKGQGQSAGQGERPQHLSRQQPGRDDQRER